VKNRFQQTREFCEEPLEEKAVVLKHQSGLVREVALRRTEAPQRVKIQTAKEEQKNRRPSALSEVGLGRRARPKKIRVLHFNQEHFCE
jgi:hypothetical protein